MLKYVLAGACLFAATCQAQTVMDGSEDELDSDVVAALNSAFLAEVSDPYAVQLVKLRPSSRDESQVCGLFNAKNLSGAYTGFKTFRFVPASGKIYLDVACN